MYKFELLNIENINREEYANYTRKNLFTTVEYLTYLSKWKGVVPIIVRISENDKLIGHFTGCVFKKFGIKVLGSPFFGWMGQHMGFDFVDAENTDKSQILDALIDYLKSNKMMSFMIFADFQYTEEDIDKCNTKLFHHDIRGTYMLDLTQPEELIFKNFKSGYRTCIRKFEKLGGTIVEEWSEELMNEHHKQLKEVFERKKMTPPSYKERLHLLHKMYPNMIYSIKALDENGNNIASSYYLAGGSYAFFQSNASYTAALQYNANQALMWHAIKHFKNEGYKVLDLAGRASYKENFGPILYNTPTTIWAKHAWLYKIVMFARKAYYSSFRLKYKVKEFFSKK